MRVIKKTWTSTDLRIIEWNPPRSNNDNLESVVSSIRIEVKSIVSGKRIQNLSEQESQAVNNLKSRNDIVIKQA